MPFNSESCNPFLPGLEVYKAIEYATNENKEILYAQKALDKVTINAMKVEKRMGAIHLMWRNYFANNGVQYYEKDLDGFFNQFMSEEFEHLSESFDDMKINKLSAILERKIPFQKRIMVEKTDYRLFKDIYNMKGKKLFALVNQWNKPGI